MNQIQLETFLLERYNLNNLDHQIIIQMLSNDETCKNGLNYNISEQVHNKGFYYFVYENDLPIGYLCFYHVNIPSIPQPTIGFDYAVLPNSRKAGYGTKLVKEFTDYFLSKGAKQIIAHVYSHNLASKIIFEKMVIRVELQEIMNIIFKEEYHVKITYNHSNIMKICN